MSALPPVSTPAAPLASPAGRGTALMLGLGLLVAGGLVDRLVLERPLLALAHPQFDPVHLLRTLLMLLAAAFTVIALAPAGVASPGGARPDEGLSTGTMRRVLALVLVLDAAFVALFLYDPAAYYRAGREDRPVEYGSALLMLGASALFVVAARAGRAQPGGAGRLARWACGALALVCFLVAMEEISWGQRVFRIPSPEVFQQHNRQKELNLHNFITSESENAYYNATFLLLVLMPFAASGLPALARHPLVARFTAGPWLMVASAVPLAYSYDLWNITLTQYSFFTTLFVLLATARHWRVADPALARAAIVMAMVCVATQAVHLGWGERQTRLWDVSEYKEFFIPLLLLVYAAQVLRRTQRSGAPDAGRVGGQLPAG